jgi:hypothetical protein
MYHIGREVVTSVGHLEWCVCTREDTAPTGRAGHAYKPSALMSRECRAGQVSAPFLCDPVVARHGEAMV